MAILNNTTFTAWLKEFYPDKVLQQELAKASPFVALVPKSKAGGKYVALPIKVSNPTGRSHTFASALQNSNASNSYVFNVGLKSDFGIIEVDGITMLSSQDNKQAFQSALEFETKSALEQLKMSVAVDAWGSGDGSRGQVAASSSAGATVTLTNPEMAIRFEKGMVLSASTTAGGALSTGGFTVVDVNYDTGVLSGTWTTIPTLAPNHYLFAVGDGANGSTNIAPTGVPGWLPATKPTSGDSFFGVDRSQSDRLTGVIFNAAGLSYREALIKAAARVERSLGQPDYVFLNPTDFGNLAIELGPNYRYEDLKGVDLGIQGIKLALGKSTVTIVADPMVPANNAFMLQMDTWNWYYVGKSAMPMVLDLDGNSMRANSSADSYITRLGVYYNYGCVSPYKNCRIINFGQ